MTERVPNAFLQALSLREPLRTGGATDALRLLDAEGDGPEFRGLILEDYAGRWLVQTDGRDWQAPPEWLRQLKPAPRAIYWKQLVQQDRAAPVWWQGERVTEPFFVRENGLRFRIDFSAGYSQGIFLDQRANRRRLRGLLEKKPGARVLNLFAYTGAFSVVAAAAGAAITTVDLSKHYLEWAKENFRLNACDDRTHEFLAGDVFDWLKRLAKKGRLFDFVVADPPTFSRDRSGRVFRVERDYPRLAAACAALVAPRGALLCTSNARGLGPNGLHRLIADEFGSRWRYEQSAMPPDFTGEPYLQTVWCTLRD